MCWASRRIGALFSGPHRGPRDPCARIDEHGSRVTLGTRSSFRQPGYPWESKRLQRAHWLCVPALRRVCLCRGCGGHIQLRSAALEMTLPSAAGIRNRLEQTYVSLAALSNRANRFLPNYLLAIKLCSPQRGQRAVSISRFSLSPVSAKTALTQLLE